MKFALFLLLALPLFGGMEQSVIPAMGSAHLTNSKRFTTNQWREIERLAGEKSVRVVTYNMLYNWLDPQLPEEYRWPARLPRIAELIRGIDPDLIATQELHRDQVADLLGLIGEEYSFYGEPCEYGELESEINGVFYRKSRLELVFAESPLMPSTPSQMKRRLTSVHVQDLRTGKRLGICNAHYSFSSADSREACVRFTLDHLAPVTEEMPLVIVGDFNTFPTRTDMGLPFYDGHYLHRLFLSAGFEEAFDRALLGHVGPISTFTNAPDEGATVFAGTGTPGVVLDHIYVNQQVTVLIHAVEPARVDGLFPSDHLPVIADLVL